MKEWWINLSLREKQTVCLGAAAVILFLLYAIIWSPLNNKINSMRTQISHDQQLLTWMKETDTLIQGTEKNLQKKSSAEQGTSLLTIVQRNINKSALSSNVSQLRQAENDSVQMSFNNVDFDKLIAWLTEIWQQEGLSISHISATASTTPGLVTADVTLKGS